MHFTLKSKGTWAGFCRTKIMPPACLFLKDKVNLLDCLPSSALLSPQRVFFQFPVSSQGFCFQNQDYKWEVWSLLHYIGLWPPDENPEGKPRQNRALLQDNFVYITVTRVFLYKFSADLEDCLSSLSVTVSPNLVNLLLLLLPGVGFVFSSTQEKQQPL